MEWLERFQQKFIQWRAVTFGQPSEEDFLTPKDVFAEIINAMEESRTEGIDGRVYVANKYRVEIAVTDQDREYIQSLIDPKEFANALDRYMSFKNYFTRNATVIQIVEVPASNDVETVVVQAKFGRVESTSATKPLSDPLSQVKPLADASAPELDEMLTVQADAPIDDLDTVHAPLASWAELTVQTEGEEASIVFIAKPVYTIGRSRSVGNDLVLPKDVQVSKRHLRIELENDGGITLFDLASTNGTFVNGKLIPVNGALNDGDEIEIGRTKIRLRRLNTHKAPIQKQPRPIFDTPEPVFEPVPDPIYTSQNIILDGAAKAPRLIRTNNGEEFAIGASALIGRGLTCDIVIPEPTCSTQQAKISLDRETRYIQDLSGRGTTIVNGRSLRTGERVVLTAGDRISLGGIVLVFQT